MATGLCAGIYSVLINDAANCDTTITVLILEPQPLSLLEIVTDTPCNGSCSGSITVNAQGGVAPYSFDWVPMPGGGQGTNTATGLCAGDYDVTVTDANGCSITQTITVGEPDPLVLVGSSTQSECGICNGTASIAISGGTLNYQSLWTQGGQIYGTGQDLVDLCAGLYLVEVTDGQGCTASVVVPVTDVEGEETTTTDGLTTCFGGCDGSVSVDVTCSDPPCTIAWFDALANDPALMMTMTLAAGDLQFVHNHSVLHDRTAFTDWPERARRRHLLRLWLAPEAAVRELPPVYAQRYGNVQPGRRGGIVLADEVLGVPLDEL